MPQMPMDNPMPPMGGNDPMMGGEQPIGGMEDPMMDSEMGDEENDPKKEIQKLSGKLSQELRNYNNDQQSPDTDLNKYVAGMVIPQATKVMTSDEKAEVINKIKKGMTDDDLNTDDSMNDMGGNDSVMNVEQLEQLLGRNFYQTFKPYSKEELKAKGKYISDVIGTYYNDGGLEGIVCAVDKDEKPTLIMSLDINNTKMTWQEAMKWAKRQPRPWHLPTKEELEKIWITKGYPNQITKMLNRGLKKYGKELEDWFCWSSSEYSEGNAWYVGTNYGDVDYDGKNYIGYSFLVAPVGSVSAF